MSRPAFESEYTRLYISYSRELAIVETEAAGVKERRIASDWKRRISLGSLGTRKQDKTYNYSLKGKKTNAGKKNCIEIDVLRRRVTAETLGMVSAHGVVGEGLGGRGDEELTEASLQVKDTFS